MLVIEKNFMDEGREFSKILRSLEQFIQRSEQFLATECDQYSNLYVNLNAQQEI
mgnify:CR=1 FL=1